ncbi:hypothetical protein [Dactylosporangium vinaceum]|uniref:Uncharacterized protein n=1 Tax=Dactylosporangium vinaceum TaxID=53362 RepID=A0ABV5M5X8_9ACTN|nr:hypothetical protein [Dactylosporangium vinaceum]
MRRRVLLLSVAVAATREVAIRCYAFPVPSPAAGEPTEHLA